MAISTEMDQLAVALVTAQGEFPSIPKDSVNPFFKSRYADLATVKTVADPIVSKHGLAISQFITGDGVKQYLTTYLIHRSGQYIAHNMELMLSKQDAQGQGSAITYARRYSYMSVLGLVADEDDDGNAATKAKPKSVAKAVKEPWPPKEEHDFDPELARTVKSALFGAKILTPEQRTSFYQLTINKPTPEDNDDLETLLKALK